MKVLLRLFSYKGHAYTIVEDNGYTLAIDHRYLDEKGCLKEQLCGLQMFVDLKDQSVSGMISRIKRHLDFDEYLKENGYDINAEDSSERLATLIHEFYNDREEARA